MEGEEPSAEGMGGPPPPPGEEPQGPPPPPGEEPQGPPPPPGEEPQGPPPPPGEEPQGPPPPPSEEPQGPPPPPGEEPQGPPPPPSEEPKGPPPPLGQEPQGPGEAPGGAVGGAEEEEDVEVTDSLTQTKHKPPGATRKKAAKRAALGYTVRPVVPARRAELVAVAKAMHRERFGKEVQELFHLEREAALQAMQTESRARVPCTVPSCRCPSFLFIPARPEDVGEFWLRRRVGFDPATWRATCRCRHSHEDHEPSAGRACRATGCRCVSFESNFLCAACDRRWEEHETFFETAETRRKGGRPYGEDYLPFAEMPELRDTVLMGQLGPCAAPQALPGERPGPSSNALPFPSPGRRSPPKQSGKRAGGPAPGSHQ
ncbi:uncharacterized protein LOC142824336 isoform X2 [Pelodiscus sinensis]|uniref:uncharacterized protein LOC142824336 isoform X2 n=1 Tax=Pelodiscus sinensis TaxID=13735 RepID=UPI003F6BCE11